MRAPRRFLVVMFVCLAAALAGLAVPAPAAAQAAAEAPPSFEAFSKFDFVPGERVIGMEDFSQDAIGDFPAKWNTNAAGEIVTLAGKPGRWLKLTRAGAFVPELTPALPDNFTLEFDLLVPPAFNSGYLFNASITELSDVRQIAQWQTASNRFTFTAWPGGPTWQTSWTSRIEANTTGGTTGGVSAETKWSPWKSDPVHVAVTRQGARMRVYFNQERCGLTEGAAAGREIQRHRLLHSECRCWIGDFVSNVRLAVGAPDTRNKLLTQGKFVTHGILFDVNSASLKPESYGTLKEIAGVLAENATLKVQIVGHTDSDGDTAPNLDLSKRRAASVREALAKEFSIDAARMTTDGKGEAEPIDKSPTSAGKANNRRVEFIKQP